MKLFLVSCFLVVSLFSFAQNITVLTSKTGISLRGLSVVTDNVVWASGNKGTVVRSVNGGQTFDWMTVAGYEGRDFRDVEAFDDHTAVIMAVDEPAVILKTHDGGKTWQKVFEDATPKMFLDAMDFSGRYGIVIGDPINHKMFVAYTQNGGDTWGISSDSVGLADGEAFFASSGTNVKLLPVKRNLFRHAAVSGGTRSEFIGHKKTSLALRQGTESQGANSIAVNESAKKVIVVGGDFANDKDTAGNCLLSANFGNTWQHPHTPPHGYRSCVAFISGNKWIACGTSGVDTSNDGGDNWTLLSGDSFHACAKAKRGAAVFLAGKDGRIAKLAE